MRASYLVTLLCIFKYSMETNPYFVEHYFLCGILEVCGIDLVEYIRFEIRTYLGVCDNILTRCFSPSTHLTSESSHGNIHDVTVISIHK